jgi:imidazolonepropionase-like amidohydrolase
VRALRAAHAFDGVRFIPGGATVLIDGDRIAGVEAREFEVPSGVEVSEYDGTVLPGLVDCHSHLVADSTVGGLERAGGMPPEAVDAVIADSLRAHVQAGETTVRDLGDCGYRTLLAAGQAADVLVVDGDVSRDVSALGTPREVIVRGSSVFSP